jgi:hypothetical protein
MAVHGDYNITITTPNGPVESHVSVDVDGHHVSGSMSANGQTAPITDGHFDDGHVTWKTHVSEPAQLDLHFSGHCQDDVCSVITGEVKAGDLGAFPFTGKRS